MPELCGRFCFHSGYEKVILCFMFLQNNTLLLVFVLKNQMLLLISVPVSFDLPG